MSQHQVLRALNQTARADATSDAKLHAPHTYRAVFISDVHLGSRGCQAAALVAFLNHIRSETIYLVGDIIDGWQLGVLGMHQVGRLFLPGAQGQISLPQSHLDVAQKLARQARKGVKIFFIPGNHDEFLRAYTQPWPEIPVAAQEREMARYEAALARGETPEREAWLSFIDNLSRSGDIYLVPDMVHETLNGQRVQLLHGDEFDALVLKGARMLDWKILGARGREAIFGLSEWLSHKDSGWVPRAMARRLLGIDETFSLAGYAHQYNKDSYLRLPEIAGAYLATSNELTARRRATQPGWEKEPLLHALLCGHSHIPALEQTAHGLYINSGDWMSHCTAAVETMDGQLKLVQWDKERGIIDYVPPRPGQMPGQQPKARGAAYG